MPEPRERTRTRSRDRDERRRPKTRRDPPRSRHDEDDRYRDDVDDREEREADDREDELEEDEQEELDRREAEEEDGEEDIDDRDERRERRTERTDRREDEEENEEDEDAGRRGGTIRLTQRELDRMIERRLEDRDRRRRRDRDREERRSLEKEAKSSRDYQKLYNSLQEEHEELRDESDDLRRRYVREQARNEVFSVAARYFPDVVGDVDEWVVPKVIDQIDEETEADEVYRLAKREVRKYAEAFANKERTRRRREPGTPSSGSRGKVDDRTESRLDTVIPSHGGREDRNNVPATSQTARGSF